jgi:acyl dehydratase
MLYPTVVRVDGFSMGVNYGANKVRFPSPVPVGSRLRLGVKLLEVEDVSGGVQMTMEFTFECEGASKPSCVAEIIFRSFF